MDLKEKEQWRLLGAMLAMNGLVSVGCPDQYITERSFKIVDDMLDSAEQNSGIATVKKRGKK